MGRKGAGALYIKQGVDSPAPQLTGGGQEFSLRSGTENIPAIVGFAKAVELIVASREKEKERIGALRDFLWRGIKKIDSKTELNGARESSPPSILGEKTLQNILNVYFPRHKAQDLLTKFDLHGLAVSSGSACRARAAVSSYVIEAIGHSKERAGSSIRFSLGYPTTQKEITKTLEIIKKTLQK